MKKTTLFLFWKKFTLLKCTMCMKKFTTILENGVGLTSRTVKKLKIVLEFLMRYSIKTIEEPVG